MDSYRGRAARSIPAALPSLYSYGPRSAQPVARALLDYKPEVMAALNARIAGRWGDVTKAVAWFMSSEPPSEPFVLWEGYPPGRAFVTVRHPALYWCALGADVAVGPGRARDMYGAVRCDVVRLYTLFSKARQGGDRALP